jgi:hypothetical protein
VAITRSWADLELPSQYIYQKSFLESVRKLQNSGWLKIV